MTSKCPYLSWRGIACYKDLRGCKEYRRWSITINRHQESHYFCYADRYKKKWPRDENLHPNPTMKTRLYPQPEIGVQFNYIGNNGIKDYYRTNTDVYSNQDGQIKWYCTAAAWDSIGESLSMSKGREDLK